ncbi:MAG: TRAP transporter substrate-binding protein DctP [Gammaproteobacteria bacterium]|nr:TRAP transporter substrate-binding protein DctP [Gammaproteobacteria bacterium]
MGLKRILGAAMLLLAAALPAQAQTEIRISTAAPVTSPLTDAFNVIKARMESKFPSALKISVHAASALFRQGTEVAAMQRGNLEMASPVTFEIEAQMPEYGVMSAAYLFRDADHLIKTFRGPIGKEFADDVAAKMGIVILDTAYLGTRTVNLRHDKPVKLPGDLAGVKMRMPPGPAFQMLAQALGATAVSMPITEVYLGLKTGAIDAQDNPTNMTRDWKFHEVTRQVILTRHLVQPVFIAIAKPAFDKLPPDQQAELRAAAREAAEMQIAKTIADEKAALDTFRQNNIAIVEPDIAAFRAAVMEQYKKADLMAKWKPGLMDRIDAVK